MQEGGELVSRGLSTYRLPCVQMLSAYKYPIFAVST